MTQMNKDQYLQVRNPDAEENRLHVLNQARLQQHTVLHFRFGRRK